MCININKIVACNCLSHPGKKLRSGAIVRSSDNSSFVMIFACLSKVDEKSPDSSSSFEVLQTEGGQTEEPQCSETQAPQCTVQVSNIPKSVSTEFLQMYFESSKRSGGDALQAIEHNEGEETALLTYETEEGKNTYVL